MPYQQITSIEFQNPDRDTDDAISELSGNLKITQGGAIASSTLYTAYWGSTKDTFLTNATGHKLSIFEIDADTNQDAVQHTLAVHTLIPSGATHVLVAATNVLGENATGATYLRIYDSTGTPGKNLEHTSFFAVQVLLTWVVHVLLFIFFCGFLCSFLLFRCCAECVGVGCGRR